MKEEQCELQNFAKLQRLSLQAHSFSLAARALAMKEVAHTPAR
jgi:hypothetical protein